MARGVVRAGDGFAAAAASGAAGDKTQHMLAFAVLSLLSALAYLQRRLSEIFIAIAVFGALIEVLQLIPLLGRSPDIADWIADCGASRAQSCARSAPPRPN